MNSLENIEHGLAESKFFCINLLTSGKLNAYLAEIEESAQNMKVMLMKQIAEQERVRRMNNIRNRAEEMLRFPLKESII